MLRWILLACSTLTAWLFYGQYRTNTLLAQWIGSPWQVDFLSVPHLLALTLPSILITVFLIVAFSFFSAQQHKDSIQLSFFAIAISLSLELLQLTSSMPGTFDVLDVLAIFVSAIICTLMLKVADSRSLIVSNIGRRIGIASLATFSFGVSLGCITECDEDQVCVDPIVMTWEEIRAQEIEPVYDNTEELKQPGKVLVDGESLFIIDRYNGIHIYDITDAQNPIRQLYLPIMGITDVSLHGDYLYANSFIDLVIVNYQAALDGVFDRNQHVSRKNNSFEPTGPDAFIPDGIGIRNREQYDDYIPDEYDPARDIKGAIVGFYNSLGEQVLLGNFPEDVYETELGTWE